MHHSLAAALASSRELRSVVRRPDRLMSRAAELEQDTAPTHRMARDRRGASRRTAP